MANPWIEHVQKYRRKHPKCSYKEAMVRAKKTYKHKKRQNGGAHPNDLPKDVQEYLMGFVTKDYRDEETKGREKRESFNKHMTKQVLDRGWNKDLLRYVLKKGSWRFSHPRWQDQGNQAVFQRYTDMKQDSPGAFKEMLGEIQDEDWFKLIEVDRELLEVKQNSRGDSSKDVKAKIKELIAKKRALKKKIRGGSNPDDKQPFRSLPPELWTEIITPMLEPHRLKRDAIAYIAAQRRTSQGIDADFRLKNRVYPLIMGLSEESFQQLLKEVPELAQDFIVMSGRSAYNR